MKLKHLLSAVLLAGAILPNKTLSAPVPADVTPPPVAREFRATWITTVWNLNWPSKAGLPVAQQKSELLAILNRAQQLKLNAVVFQVRGSGDAFYASPTEPWSHFLTGTQGQAPQPFYDPLAFAVEEAHKRGLELHAWFNPFRARVTANQTLAPGHVANRHPEYVRKYGKFLWLDPGDVRARDYGIALMVDVVKRYNIDGVQIDDYFYPSVEKDAAGKPIPFDDEITWQRYVQAGGKLSRDDWRRENINIFIQRLYANIKAAKRWVKLGVSPPGIWRPGHPASIKGWDVYSEIYADAKTWLNRGWMDYLAPQLYWKISAPNQSFPVLMKWWVEQSKRGRHVWPGLNTVEVGGKFDVAEITEQIRLTREQTGAKGHIHFDARPLLKNTKGLTDELTKLYAQPALVPASPWLGQKAPEKPNINVRHGKKFLQVSWKTANSEKLSHWILQQRTGSVWATEILPANRTQWSLKSSLTPPDYLAVTAISQTGVASLPTVVSLR